MDKNERKTIERVIKALLSDECDVTSALTMLAPLVGKRYPAGEILKRSKPVNFFKAIAGPNRPFISEYMARIGSRGGKISKRKLTKAQAKAMNKKRWPGKEKP